VRDFIECGETWAALSVAGAIDNVPRQAKTIAGFVRLCEDVIDPLVDHFGPVRLTYAFAARPLTRHIRRQIAPSLDQHAGWEVGRTGNLVCGRGGQAVDLTVAGVPSGVVARWIVAETPFDRLYFYGSDRPIHVSIGPENSRTVVWMRGTSGGRRVPRAVPVDRLPG